MSKLEKILMGLLSAIIAAGGAAAVYTFWPKPEPKTTAACSHTSAQTHTVTLRPDGGYPAHIDGRLCDKLTIKNDGPRTRLVSFGRHNQHVAYDGIKERPLMAGKSFTITLSQTGDYLFHDHFEEAIGATFSVID